MIRRRQRIFGIILLVLAAAWLAASSSKVQWRARLVTLKLQGSLAGMSWTDLLRRMIPSSMTGPQLREIEGIVAGLVKAVARGERPCPVLWRTPLGTFWGRSEDGPSIGFLMQEQLDNIYQRGPVVIRSGDVVFDVGAHIGTFSRVALNHGARLVVAFEPEPTNVVCFKRTFQKEIADGRVILVEAALWETSGTLRFKESATNSACGSMLLEKDIAGIINVPATTLDDAVRRLNLDRVDYIKMDIEGAERYALRGGRETLSRFAPRMAICIYHKPDDPVVIPEVVLAFRPAYRSFARAGQQIYFY